MKKLLQTLRGISALFLLAIITIIGFIPLLPAALVKLLVPIPIVRKWSTHAVVWVADHWARATSKTLVGFSRAYINIYQDAPSLPQGRVLIMANHQSWTDVLLLCHIIKDHYPFPRFFIKDQLRWLPVVGLACWALDFPFMKRYSREKIRKNPALRNKDIDTIKKSCTVFRDWPVSIVNFVEGTRATPAKRKTKKSPYQTLLPPKTGGVALACNAMGDLFDGIIDVTLGYVDTPRPNLWDFACGRIPEVSVRVRQLQPPVDLQQPQGPYTAEYRRQFKLWLEGIWAENDLDITAIQDPSQPQDSFYSPLFRDVRKEVF